jgi:hypothetical protein
MTPVAHSLRACLPSLADRTHDQLRLLFEDPTPDRCDVMVRALHEVETICRRLCAELLSGEPPTV